MEETFEVDSSIRTKTIYEQPCVYMYPISYKSQINMNHEGLYDEWKSFPFVDNPDHTGEMFGEYNTKIGKTDNTNKLHDKYQQLYEKYNQENGRLIGDGNKSDTINGTDDKKQDVVDSDNDIKPVEGGLEDMTSEWTVAENKKERKHRRNRENRKSHRHHKSVKKDLSEEQKELKREKRIDADTNDETNDALDGIDIDKFYKEHPYFKKNVATITDTVKDNVDKPSTTDTYATGDSSEAKQVITEDSDSEDDADQKDADDYDEDDDHDDKVATSKESESQDESSEAYNDYYDYYDEDGDSSYSSSEERAEQEMLNQTPHDWFKQYDRMYGDQPAQTETQSENNSKDEDEKKAKEVKDKKYVDKEKIVTDKSSIPKTDVEPSTSPNPPTPKKDIKSTVTQPAYPQWKERVETWNLIESKPVESCNEDAGCASGRMCKFGLCLCGQPDFCDGHYKPVCGSDGRLYPSHCELHRTACVLGVHIRLDHDSNCEVNVVGPLVIEKKVDQSTSQTSTVVDPKTDGSQETTTETTTSESADNVKINKAPKIAEIRLTAVHDHLKSLEEDESKDSKVDVNIIEGSRDEVSEDVDAENTQQTSVESKEDSFVVSKDTETTAADDDSDDDDDDNDDDEDVGLEDNHTLDGKFDFDDDYDSDDDDYYDDYYDDDDSDEESESTEETDDSSEEDTPSLVPMFCTPDLYQKFKADVLEYHCIFFDEEHCDRQTQEEKQKLAAVMFNYFDRDLSNHIEKEELWEMQLLERMDEISSLCTLLDIVTFDELGERDSKLSIDEFIQAFDIPDLLEHKTEIVPLSATVGNGLDIKCDITESSDIIWKRNGVDLSLIDFPGISVLGEGSLYLDTVGFHMVGNLTCHERQKPSIKQVHQLTVQKPPHVLIHVDSHEQGQGISFDIRCHAEGYPKPTITWMFEDQPVKQGAKYHIQMFDNTLTVQDPDYVKDTGVYKCLAKNPGNGESEASVTITVHSDNDTSFYDNGDFEETFIIFHDNGYTLHEPRECLTQRHVLPDFGNFFFVPDELDAPPSLCEPGIPCVWGGAINVKNTFVYATQPRENRVVVIDMDTFNPNQVIFTDHMPVSLHYIAHLDEVWVLCWNGEDDNGSKTVVIIRNASQKTQHHAVHTQPIGNKFVQVQDIFLPNDNEFHHPYKFGYTVHNGQQGLFKISLEEKKYTRAVDLTKYDCVPKSVAFVPLGGHSLIQCVKKTSYDTTTHILTLDYITDTVKDNMTLAATPYVSPDVNNVVFVEEETGKIIINQITDNGKIVHQFDVTVGSSVGHVTFHKARYSHGYDLYLTSTQYPHIYSISLENGKVDTIKDIGQPDSEMYLPWFKKGRPLETGNVFSDFLGTTAMSSMLILNGRHHNIQCDYRDLQNPAVVIYAHLTL
ncbi:follistatin-related protein 5-like [Ruditapes philippinarum]|uniref:follistatin-related protein 5-like n=1 Tax=Ruditapes philippinarum TaxID=129788 RepID=UPI00295B6BCE|nr:follistatin-related protein 5-like [Ruditapes philippinarum]